MGALIFCKPVICYLTGMLLFNKTHLPSNQMGNPDLPNTLYHTMVFHTHENTPVRAVPFLDILYDRKAYIYLLRFPYMAQHVM